MAILILSRFDINIFPVDKWLSSYENDKIVFVQKKFEDDYQAKGFTEVKGFENYDSDAPLELAALKISEIYKITKIFAFDERDIKRAGRLRSYLKIKGQQVESAIAYRDKYIMKEILCRNGISVPPFGKADTVYDILLFIHLHGYPVLMKPRNMYSAINVKKINNDIDLEDYLKQHDLNDMMIEKFMPYEMVSCNGFIVNNQIIFSSVTIYLKPRMEYRDPLVAITVPDTFENAKLIQQYCREVVACLPEVGSGPFHSEIFIHGNQCYLCEIASRTAGGGINECMENSYKIKFYEEWAKSTFIEEYVFPTVNFQKFTASILIPKHGGKVKCIVETLPFSWIVSNFKYVHPGDIIEESCRNGDKVAMVLVEGGSYEETIEHAQDVIIYYEREFLLED